MRDLTEKERDWLNADWIKVAGWIHTFTEGEKAAFEKLGDARSLCMIAWMTQRYDRLWNLRSEPKIPDDPGLQETVELMKEHGVPWDRVLPDHDDA
jgi:hypothetical protein